MNSSNIYTENWIKFREINNNVIYLDNKEMVTGVKIQPRNIFILEENYQNQIILHINKYYINKEKSYTFCEGIGTSNILFKRRATRKNINNLIEFTKVLTDDELLKINKIREINHKSTFKVWNKK